MKLAALALLCAGCLGPLLPLPPARPGAHSRYCRDVTCPTEAAQNGGTLEEWHYRPDRHVCQCVTRDRGVDYVHEVPWR